MELTAKEFFELKEPMADHVERDMYYYYDKGTILQLMEMYHQAKMLEAKEKGLIKIKQEIKEHNLDGFYDND